MKLFATILSLLLFYFGLPTTTVFAAVTPTPQPTNQFQDQINQLKDKIASKVAQLNLVEKRGVIGTVSDVTDTQITINDMAGNTRFIDVDELTKFASPSAKDSFGISDIKKNTQIGVLGLYNKQSRRILARFVDVLQTPTILSGVVLSVQSADFTFTMATLTNPEILVDVENFTKTTAYTKADGNVKSGFSKLSQKQRVLVVGFPDIANKNKIIASRVIVFPELPANPKISLVNPNDIAPVTPSTGSGKKLTPLGK